MSGSGPIQTTNDQDRRMSDTIRTGGQKRTPSRLQSKACRLPICSRIHRLLIADLGIRHDDPIRDPLQLLHGVANTAKHLSAAVDAAVKAGFRADNERARAKAADVDEIMIDLVRFRCPTARRYRCRRDSVSNTADRSSRSRPHPRRRARLASVPGGDRYPSDNA